MSEPQSTPNQGTPFGHKTQTRPLQDTRPYPYVDLLMRCKRSQGYYYIDLTTYPHVSEHGGTKGVNSTKVESETTRQHPSACVSPYGSADHLIRLEEKRRRNREPERFGGLEVDDQPELHGLLYRQVSGLGAFEDFVHISSGAVVHCREGCAIEPEPAAVHELLVAVYRGQPALCREVHDPCAVCQKQRIPQDDEGRGALLAHRRKCLIERIGLAHCQHVRLDP